MAPRAQPEANRANRGWIAPRSGGYRPGGDFSTTTTTADPKQAPRGNAGVVKPSPPRRRRRDPRRGGHALCSVHNPPYRTGE